MMTLYRPFCRSDPRYYLGKPRHRYYFFGWRDALVALWLRGKSVLDLWLIVSVCTLVAELGVTAFIIVSRFSLGFYTQRVFSLAASTVVLSALLGEAVVLYGR